MTTIKLKNKNTEDLRRNVNRNQGLPTKESDSEASFGKEGKYEKNLTILKIMDTKKVKVTKNTTPLAKNKEERRWLKNQF